MSSPDLFLPALHDAFVFLAQTSKPAPPPLLDGLKTFVPVLGVGLVLYFLLFGMKPKGDKVRKEMLANLKRNDRVETIGGIRGTVVDVREGESDVVVKVDEGTNTKIRFARTAIREVLIDGKPSDAKK